MFDATQSPEELPKLNIETDFARYFEIDLSQGSPVYRTQAKDGGIYTWDATELVGLSPQERKEILTDLLLRIGSVAEVAIKNRLDYLFVFDPQSSETRIEQYGAFSRELNQKTVSQVFRLVIKKAQERGEREKVIALEHALRNGSRLPSNEIQHRIREIQTEQDTSSQEAFESILFAYFDPDDLKPLGSQGHRLITVPEYQQRQAENEALSQPVKQNLGTTVELNFDPDPVSQAARKVIINKLTKQLGNRVLDVKSDDKGVTLSIELDCADLQQRDLTQIMKMVGALKDRLDISRTRRSDLTVGEEVQRIIHEQEKRLQQARQASHYLKYDSDIELHAQRLRIFQFLNKNLDIVLNLGQIPLQDLRENDWFQFAVVMKRIEPIKEGEATLTSTE